MLRRLIALCVLSFAVPLAAQAAEPAVATPLGTSLAEQGDWQLYATVGVPDLELGALTGLSSAADVATRITLGYGESLRLGGFAAKVSSGVRLRLGQTGGVTWLLRAEPGLAVHAAATDYPPFHRRADSGASTFAIDTAELTAADPVDSLDWPDWVGAELPPAGDDFVDGQASAQGGHH